MGVIISPLVSHAASTLLALDSVPGLESASTMSLADLLNFIFKTAIGIALAAAVVRIFYGGFLFATVESITGKSDAKNMIKNAFYGLGLILAAWLILYTIDPNLLSLNAI
jgi:hypothetical protein